MPDAPEMPDAIADAVNSAIEKKIKSAQNTARMSILVAVLSLTGVAVGGYLTFLTRTNTATIESETKEKLAALSAESEQNFKELDARVQRSEHAIDRSEKVAAQYQLLLTRQDSSQKRLAFLNLWHLHTEEEERKILILTALQYAGKEVQDLLLVLASELGSHEQLITGLTQRTACLEVVSDASHDCIVNEYAKELLAKLAPESALEILLEAMAREALPSPQNGNLDILRTLIQEPKMFATFSALYREKYTDLVGLSYLLYAYEDREPFRKILASNLTKDKKRELVSFVSEWPLQGLEPKDGRALIEFLIPLLSEFDNATDQYRLDYTFRTLNKLRDAMFEEEKRAVSQALHGFVTDPELSWILRSEAAKTLVDMDIDQALQTFATVNVEGNEIMAEDFVDALASKTDFFQEAYAQQVPGATSNFAAWQDWIVEVKQ